MKTAIVNIPIALLLKTACRAAEAAGAAIMEIYQSSNFDVAIKSDLSPLTIADRTAHEIISSHLSDSGLPILSEEGKTISYEARCQWQLYWLVDPLDGTKEFIKRNGEFTVNIALVHQGVALAGVVYAPCFQTLYYGSKETGVFRRTKDAEIKLLPAAQRKSLNDLLNQESVTIVASRSHSTPETNAFVSRFKNAQLTSLGSSLKLMLLIDGKADIYPRLAPTMEWDTAAAHALLLAMNRDAYQEKDGGSLIYNKPILLNPPFIAY